MGDTGDQRKLLSREPDVAFSTRGAAELPTISVDDTVIYQEIVDSARRSPTRRH